VNRRCTHGLELGEDPVARVGAGGRFIIAVIVRRQFRQVRLHIARLERGDDRLDLRLARGAARVCRSRRIIIKDHKGMEKRGTYRLERPE
jgi:hypothetical protein